jgi:hypothetical protein
VSKQKVFESRNMIMVHDYRERFLTSAASRIARGPLRAIE